MIVSALPGVATAYIDRDIADIRIMNKAAGKTYSIDIPVGDSAQFEKLNLEKQEDIDRLYELLWKYKGKVFRTEEGRKFVEEIQSKTSKYKYMERKCSILNKIAIVCICLSVIVLIPIAYFC